MRYIKQFVLILAVSFAGEVLNRIIPLPIPAGVYGIIILFLLLATKLVPLEAVEEAGRFLIEIMPLMFIPAAVGIITSWGNIKSSLFAYTTITVVSTIIVMAVSGIVTELVIKIGGHKK
ncbi:MAG: CidA/LrgA family protein [Ruminococcaceae bacterium]|nr:CidA/LrgA family protein [Oscillospiraceae bacterium]